MKSTIAVPQLLVSPRGCLAIVVACALGWWGGSFLLLGGLGKGMGELLALAWFVAFPLVMM